MATKYEEIDLHCGTGGFRLTMRTFTNMAAKVFEDILDIRI